MAYLQKINDLLEATILKNTTSKILQHMGRIRNTSSISQARRWVMELIQNARDVAYEDGIKIRITETDDKLIFEHNGKPFRVKDVLSIINQASSKDDSIEAVGKFGTGFVTTFQLSESVVLKSVLYEEGEEAIPFEIKLDRSGKKDEDIERSIYTSMDQLKACVTEVGGFSFEKRNYNTAFIYDLMGDYEKEIARIGLEDLKNTINAILKFSQKIQEIKIVVNTRERKKTISYRPLASKILEEGKNIFEEVYCWDINDEKGSRVEKYKLISITEDSLSLALFSDFDNNILKLDGNKARLFIDFPLVGSESFPFPVIINDRKLNPNEPRSGITLVDSERSDEAIENKQIIKRSVKLYDVLFHYLLRENYGNIWNMMEIPLWQENPEMSETWVRENIYTALYRTFDKDPIIETDKGMVSLNNSLLRLVDADSMAEKEDVYELISRQNKYYTAKFYVDWDFILRGYFSESILIQKIQMKGILTNIVRVVREFSDWKDAFDWVNFLYKACMKREEYATEIKSGKVNIYPSQHPNEFTIQRTLYSYKEVRKDISKDELLREIAGKFFGHQKMVDYRSSLVHKDFDLVEDGLKEFGDADIAKYINQYVLYVISTYKVDSVREPIQIGCAKLAEWIDNMMESQDSEKAREYFPSFVSEEGRAKLLTSKAVAAISRELRVTKNELEKLSLRNQELSEELKRYKEQEKEEEKDLQYDSGDVCFTFGELEEYGGDKEEFLRMIGTAGEDYAHQRMIDFYEKNQLDEIGFMAGFGIRKHEDLTYKVIRPDTENYKQRGYDLLVIGSNEAGERVSEDYFEVKTHTTRSKVKNVLSISNEQMKLALMKKENYHVLKISFALKERACVEMWVYKNLEEKIFLGELINLDKSYRFFC